MSLRRRGPTSLNEIGASPRARQHDGALLTGDSERLRDSALASARDVNDNVDAVPVRDLFDALAEVLGLNVDRVVGAELARHVEAHLVARESGHDDAVRSGLLRGERGRQAHLTGALNEDRLAPLRSAVAAGPFDAVGERQVEREHGGGNRLVDPVHDGVGGEVHVAAEPAP